MLSVPGQSYNGAALTGLPMGPLASAIATIFGGADCNIRIISADEVAKLRGEWARGYALDQSMSGEKARHALGWRGRASGPAGRSASPAVVTTKLKPPVQFPDLSGWNFFANAVGMWSLCGLTE